MPKPARAPRGRASAGTQFRAWISLRRSLWIVSIAVILFYLGVVAIAAMRPAGVLTVIAAKSELLTFQVKNPELARFAVEGATMIDAANPDGRCVTGELRPSMDTIVSYVIEDNAFVILLTPPPTAPTAATFNDDAVMPGKGGTLHIVYQPGKCALPDKLRLPIIGPAILGDDYAGEGTHVLQSGTITISAQSFGSVFGLVAGTRGSGLYPAATYDLAAGTRLRQCIGRNDKHESWRGYVDVSRDDHARVAMDVHAFTSARSLALTVPGGTADGRGARCPAVFDGSPDARTDAGSVSGQETLITIPVLAQITGDPLLARLAVAITFIFVLIQLIGQIASVPDRRR